MRLNGNTDDLSSAECFFGGCGAVVRGDPDRLTLIPGRLPPVPVITAFEREARHLPFHHARIAASPADREQPGQDLDCSLDQRTHSSVRGKSPPARSPAGAPGAACG